ncbi:MAG: TIGR03936 family radical SAM-associated protein [Actinomycetota bacterium]
MTTRLRLSYTKLGKVRFTGHRDVAHLWERALRKAQIPVAVSAGFTPRPRLAFGLALPTGAESLVELLDVIVDVDTDDLRGQLDDVVERLSAALPMGLDVTDAWLPGDGIESLQESVVASSWSMLLEGSNVPEAVMELEASSATYLERERKGERFIDDVRPSILALTVVDAERWIDRTSSETDPVTAVEVMLSTSGRGVRPTEFVEVLLSTSDPWDRLRRVVRTNQWIEREGQRVDVLADRAVCSVGSARERNSS